MIRYRKRWWQFWRPIEPTPFQRCLAVHIFAATNKGALK